MKKKLSDKTFNLIFSVCAILIMWVMWVVAYRAEGNDYVIPSFTDAMKAAWKLLGEKSFWLAFGNTLLRTWEAFALSFVLAALFSVISACCKPFAAIFRPFVAVLRTIPIMAVILILLLWTSPLAAPVLVAFLVTFPMVYTQFSAAFCGIDRRLFEMAKVYGVPPIKRALKMYIPLVMPNVLAQTGAAFSLTLKVIVSAEVMARTYVSIGGMMQEARNYLEIPELFALTVLTVAAGAFLEWALGKLTLFTRKWTYAGAASQTKSKTVNRRLRAIGSGRMYDYRRSSRRRIKGAVKFRKDAPPRGARRLRG